MDRISAPTQTRLQGLRVLLPRGFESLRISLQHSSQGLADLSHKKHMYTFLLWRTYKDIFERRSEGSKMFITCFWLPKISQESGGWPKFLFFQ